MQNPDCLFSKTLRLLFMSDPSDWLVLDQRTKYTYSLPQLHLGFCYLEKVKHSFSTAFYITSSLLDKAKVTIGPFTKVYSVIGCRCTNEFHGDRCEIPKQTVRELENDLGGSQSHCFKETDLLCPNELWLFFSSGSCCDPIVAHHFVGNSHSLHRFHPQKTARIATKLHRFHSKNVTFVTFSACRLNSSTREWMTMTICSRTLCFCTAKTNGCCQSAERYALTNGANSNSANVQQAQWRLGDEFRESNVRDGLQWHGDQCRHRTWASFAAGQGEVGNATRHRLKWPFLAMAMHCWFRIVVTL